MLLTTPMILAQAQEGVQTSTDITLFKSSGGPAPFYPPSACDEDQPFQVRVHVNAIDYPEPGERPGVAGPVELIVTDWTSGEPVLDFKGTTNEQGIIYFDWPQLELGRYSVLAAFLGIAPFLPSEAAGVLDIIECVVTVDIDIKPGSYPNAINLKSRGTVPVAILSTPSFDAPSAVDVGSLTFGRTGNEMSLAFCGEPEDVNGDGLSDLVCHFYTQKTGFQSGDTQGTLKGTAAGTPIIGIDSVRIVPPAKT